MHPSLQPIFASLSLACLPIMIEAFAVNKLTMRTKALPLKPALRQKVLPKEESRVYPRRLCS